MVPIFGPKWINMIVFGKLSLNPISIVGKEVSNVSVQPVWNTVDLFLPNIFPEIVDVLRGEERF